MLLLCLDDVVSLLDMVEEVSAAEVEVASCVDEEDPSIFTVVLEPVDEDAGSCADI